MPSQSDNCKRNFQLYEYFINQDVFEPRLISCTFAELFDSMRLLSTPRHVNRLLPVAHHQHPAMLGLLSHAIPIQPCQPSHATISFFLSQVVQMVTKIEIA